jgi:hypothetical protein
MRQSVGPWIDHRKAYRGSGIRRQDDTTPDRGEGPRLFREVAGLRPGWRLQHEQVVMFEYFRYS